MESAYPPLRLKQTVSTRTRHVFRSLKHPSPKSEALTKLELGVEVEEDDAAAESGDCTDSVLLSLREPSEDH